MAPAWMTSEEAARRLGVKSETLYAYVSRGLIRSERVPGQRRSRFLRSDVERHAARSRRGGRAGGLEVVIESELTLLDPSGSLHYRGWDVTDAVRTASFEQVAAWLWTATTDLPATGPSHGDLPAAGIPAGGPPSLDLAPVDRLRAAVIPLRAADPLRGDRRPASVAAAGRALLIGFVDALPILGIEPPAGAATAARLWPRLTASPPSARRIHVLDAALVLLADHELATSTLAARLAASTWADPYLVVAAGLAVLGGPLHGGASERGRVLLRDAGTDRASARVAIGDRLAAGERIHGLGHTVYETSDPRARVLFDLLDTAGDTPAALTAVLDVVAERGLPFPNVDLALAGVAEAYDMIDGAGEVVFAVARTVGWLAHAIEEYEHALRYRTRAAYVGPAPARTRRPRD